jgi:hypothetical protein
MFRSRNSSKPLTTQRWWAEVARSLVKGWANPGLTLTNQSTGENRSASTYVNGNFVIASVQPGTYKLRVHTDGFKEREKTGLVLTASERLSAGTLTLAVGTVMESIEVTAETTPVQTASQERSSLLNDKQMETLMARGRDFMGLLRVLPGVVGGGGGESSELPARPPSMACATSTT